MSDGTDTVAAALDQIQLSVDSWRISTAPNVQIEGLDYEKLCKYVQSIPSMLRLSQNKDLIGLANDIAGDLPRIELQDTTADREAIVINSRILVLKDHIYELTRSARRNGYYDPESQILNVSGPEADELRQTILDELSGVKTAIDEIKAGLAKKNVDPGISIGVPGVSINLSKALSFITDQTEDARNYLFGSTQINIASLRKKLNSIAIKSSKISNFIKEKLKVFGVKVVEAAKRLDLMAHQALSNGLKLAKKILDVEKSSTNTIDTALLNLNLSVEDYITKNTQLALEKLGLNIKSIVDVRSTQLRQRFNNKASRSSGYWIMIDLTIDPENNKINSMKSRGGIQIEFYVEPKIVGLIAAYGSNVLLEVVRQSVVGRNHI